MNRKFKLIKVYPNSPKLGTEVELTISGYYNLLDYKYIAFDSKYVENNPEYWEEIIEIPEYVKCDRALHDSSLFTKNKIYKVISYNYTTKIIKVITDNNSELEVSNIGLTPDCTNTTNFIPSTKEAFDLQNKPKFEVGKWYYFEAYYDKIPNIAKCDELDNDTFSTKEWVMINNRKEYISTGAWYYNQMYNIKELSIKDIQQYLPDGHPDKIKGFKVGDWVYAEESYNNDDFRRDNGHKDKFIPIFQIQEIRGSWARPVKGGCSEINIKLLRYATPEEIAKANEAKVNESEFKIGDWVKWKSSSSGDSYQVTKLSNKGFSVAYEGRNIDYSTPIEKLCILANKQIKTLFIGNPRKTVEISDTITAEGQTVSIKTLEDIYEDMIRNPFDDCPWRVTFPQVKIGCSTFTSSEIKQVIDAYYEYNK